jgi:Pvc16 N-terminal domain
MLHLLDESLEAFLRATVPLGKREVDVSFAAPDRDWAARVSRPTVNLYLWDVRRNLDERDAGMETVIDGNGRPQRRPPLPRIDCRYLVTAWTSEVQDEHSLLGHTLAALLLHNTIEERYLAGSFAQVRPIPTIEVAAAGDGRDNSDFWSALGGQLKPGLDVVVTATVDAALLVAAGPPVDRYTIRAWRKVDEDPAAQEPAVSERSFVGGRSASAEAGDVVVTRRGAGRVGANGAFLVPAEPGDEVSVDGAVRGRVPDTGPIDLPD